MNCQAHGGVFQWYSRMKSKNRVFLAIILIIFSTGMLYALPPWVPLEQRTADSDLVVAAKVDRISVRPLNAGSSSVSARLTVTDFLKGQYDSREFYITFLIFPQSMENHLREPPPEGSFIFFLKKVTVTDASGRQGQTLVLYHPLPFSYVDDTPENRSKILAGK